MQLFGGAGDHVHMHTVLGQRECDRPANPTTATGNHGDTARLLLPNHRHRSARNPIRPTRDQ